jgi:hypothetical protein
MPDLAACLAKAEMAICEARSFTSPDPDVANETRLGLLLQAESWIQEAQKIVESYCAERRRLGIVVGRDLCANCEHELAEYRKRVRFSERKGEKND